jgi:hypothetical protein
MQCVHFVKPNIPSYIDLGICNKFGKKNIINGQVTHFYARDCRNISDLCGLDGKYFLHKNQCKRLWALEAQKVSNNNKTITNNENTINSRDVVINKFLYNN